MTRVAIGYPGAALACLVWAATSLVLSLVLLGHHGRWGRPDWSQDR